MSREMATQVLDKKLRQLDEKLARRHVCLHLTPEAHEWLLKEGFKPNTEPAKWTVPSPPT